MADEKLYSFLLLVNLRDPLRPDDPAEQSLVGYYRNLCVRADSEVEAKARVSTAVTDGTVSWEESEWEAISLDELQNDREKTIDLSPSAVIVYQSGRAFFHEG